MSKAQPLALLVIALVGCHHTNTDGTSFTGDGGTTPSGLTGGSGGNAGSGPGSGGAGANGSGGVRQDAGFVFNLPDGGPLAAGGDAGASCGVLMAIVRDFKDDHPDMEKTIATVKGIVKPDLGSDDKPVYAPAGPTSVTAGQASFDQWYRDVPGVNIKVPIALPLTMTSPGVFVYDNSSFFPVDGIGWGNQGRPHNFHFTTEIHATFLYRGGERFTFTGDDDVFIFVNKKLALDLGGVHLPESGTIDFDAQAAQLGITRGNVYSFDAFHAERHTTMSNFRMETSIGCLQTVIK
jgi:fibro-slime domain-containing protein